MRSCWLLIPFLPHSLISFFFNDTATTEIYTLSLHDALPISAVLDLTEDDFDFLTSNKVWIATDRSRENRNHLRDRKSGSAGMPRPISYAVFCLKKKKGKSHYTE